MLVFGYEKVTGLTVYSSSSSKMFIRVFNVLQILVKFMVTGLTD